MSQDTLPQGTHGFIYTSLENVFANPCVCAAKNNALALLGLGWGSRIGAELSTGQCWAAAEE